MHISPKFKTLFQKFNLPRVALLCSLAAAATLHAADDTIAKNNEDAHSHHDGGHPLPSRLVELVRDATRQYIDVNAATASNYKPFLGCISGPDHGAMGIHYVNGDYVGDNEIDIAKPEALIYEPMGDALRLVGVEFIVDQATWLKHHDGPPVLEGQSFQLVGSPNRYNLLPFFELHVWAWRQNPNGAYVDWNTRVTCEGK